MDVFDAMRTTFAARQYTDREVSDETIHRLLDHARFAPSGGNRQGWRVIVIKDKAIRRALRDCMQPTIKQYKAEAAAGETPFNSINPSKVNAAAIETTSAAFPLIDGLEYAPVVLVICVDLTAVTSFDKDLPRVGVISGASIYPFVWNILLAARNEGLGGVLTTFIAAQEDQAKSILNIPADHAIAALIGIGEPVKQLTRLRRKPVSAFTFTDRFGGETFNG